ncbi:hypothetical protein NEOLEDRAFT_1068857, partial [Neolentinus lepideus HHB14362 ss-1]
FSNMFRNAIAQTSRGARSLHTTPVARKTVTEKVKDVGDKVNKTVGRTLAGAIEKGEQATETTKQTLGNIPCTKTEQAKEKAGEASTVAGQKANETAAKAREGKEETKETLSR